MPFKLNYVVRGIFRYVCVKYNRHIEVLVQVFNQKYHIFVTLFHIFFRLMLHDIPGYCIAREDECSGLNWSFYNKKLVNFKL